MRFFAVGSNHVAGLLYTCVTGSVTLKEPCAWISMSLQGGVPRLEPLPGNFSKDVTQEVVFSAVSHHQANALHFCCFRRGRHEEHPVFCGNQQVLGKCSCWPWQP
jgi:hypothetical protein